MATTTKKDSGPIEGYIKTAPEVTLEGDVATIDAQSVYYKHMNEAVRGSHR